MVRLDQLAQPRSSTAYPAARLVSSELRTYRFLLLCLPPFRLPAFPALEIAAARDFGNPLRLSASYLRLFLIDFPAIPSFPNGH